MISVCSFGPSLKPLIALTLIGGSLLVAADVATAAEAEMPLALAPVSDSGDVADVADATASVALGVYDDALMGQVTSVSQLRDVRPTDWAFQALQSLVERYGCIAGYPDGTYRGDRAMTRYEFAAGLNACLDRVSELVASATAEMATQDDLAVLQRLQEEFQAELATLRGRVDSLESRTAELEANQFSTTTKLSGEVIFSGAGAWGAAPGGDDANAVLNSRVRLNLSTSFSGKDLLLTGLQAHTFPGGNSSIAGTLGYGDPVFNEASHVRLGTEPQFPSTSPLDLSSTDSGSLELYKLLYIFPVGDKVTAFVGPKAEVSDAFPSVLPFANEGQGALSRFGTLPASHRVSGGTSGTGLAAAAGLIWNVSDAIDLRALYGNVNSSIAGNEGFPGTPLGAGVFSGSYVAATQLTVNPSDRLQAAFNYAHSYHQINILATGLGSADIGAVLFPAADVAAIADEGISFDTLGATFNYKLTPKLELAGTATYIMSDLVDVNASTNFLTWMAGVKASDIFREGNSAGLLFGQPLTRQSTGGRAIDPADATPYHLESYFNFKVNDNISVTPGAVVIFNPEGQSDRDTVVMPVVRTTFSF